MTEQLAEEKKTTTKITRSKEFLKKMSVEYEARGLTQVCVDNDQVQALHTENNRERDINRKLQKDVEALASQFAHGEEVRRA